MTEEAGRYSAPAPSWAAKYTTETLERALAAAYEQTRDVAHLFDVEWHARQAGRIAQIQAELDRRYVADAGPTGQELAEMADAEREEVERSWEMFNAGEYDY